MSMYGDLPEATGGGGLRSVAVATLVEKIFRNARAERANEMELSSERCGKVEDAVVVRGAVKSYGRVQVLDCLDMNVPKGGIYGLLGASGCGKTTLLACIVGIKRLNAGEVRVFGEGPASDARRVGYMPQATGLYGEFTVGETLLFFGRLIGLENEKIRERTKYLADLMMLPSYGSGAVKELSGGEQRRLSLAVALLHEPELLILDEPTVGVDCVLRQLIWEHFSNLTAKQGVTIIMTTHYIEEARQADRVGVMRGGRLMAEAPPALLIRRQRAETLEEVFLALSVQQNQDRAGVGSYGNGSKTCSSHPFQDWRIKWTHMKALLWKNALWLRKNLSTLVIVTLLPVVMVSLFCATVGHAPSNLTVAVVNFEEGHEACEPTLGCDARNGGCALLRHLEDGGMVPRNFATEREAMLSVVRGETYASIVIGRNFSRGLHLRAYHWEGLGVHQVADSTVDVLRDLSNKHLAIYMQVMLYTAFQQLLYDYVESCGVRWETRKLPLKWDTVYGSMNPNFTDFSISGVLLSITFIVGVILTAWAMLIERNEASLERTHAMGVNSLELLVAHVVVEYAIMCTQTLLILVCAFLAFGMTIKGSIPLTVLLLMLSGLCGISYGLLISCLTNSPIGITLGALGSYFTVILTNGLIWPIEAMHWLLKPFALLLPLTKSTESLRSILHKDWGLLDGDVYLGFVAVVAWGIVFFALSVVLIKLQKN